jgi:trk system potassium uptake protein
MINFKLVYKILGSLLFIEASLMLWCLVMSLCYKEDDVMPFLYGIVATILFGSILRLSGRKADNTLSRRDAYLVVTLAWIIFSAFGALPFMFGGYIKTFTDAFFETMSGFTTTGATIIDDVEVLPHGILFWRSLTHWIGGLGIVFFTIALLPSLVGGSVKVFAAEATGPLKTKLHPRLSTNAKSIWMVFLVITVACIVSYHVFGMGWFDSVNYAMSTLGTGGFATHNDSLCHFHSPGLEYASALFCLLSGANFALLYCTIIKLDIKKLFQNSEFKFYIIFISVSALFIAYQLVAHNGYGVERAFRSGLFEVTSFITTTGLFNDDAGKWPHITWVVLSLCMFIGACSGSTSGGFKCVRGVMVLKILRNEFRQILHPNAVLPLKIDGVNVSQQKRVTLLAFLVVYLLLCLIPAMIMIIYGIDNTNAITIALSSLSNVGPTLGTQIGPTSSWSMLPDFAKWMCSMLMLMGRLEIFTVLVIFTPAFWKEN